MHYYPTRKSLNSAIEIIENADRLLGGSLKVTDTHKVFNSILIPALIGAAAAGAAVVCLVMFIHPLAGIAAAVIALLIAKRIRDRRLNMQRIIVYCRVIERKVEIESVLNDELTGHLKEQFESSIGDTDPEKRKEELSKIYSDIIDITALLAHDAGNK
ncbi:MAG: hypothetical protein J6X60_10880 [Ruminiclostridium sp.]|nr:hypothetical protein [Ruminiclostridium sp.]